MSAVLQTVIGAIAAIAGGFLAAWWQTSRADAVARNIRRAERREQGLLELNQQVAQALIDVGEAYRSVDYAHKKSSIRDPAIHYYGSRKSLDRLHVFWDHKSVGVIPDQTVINAYRALIATEQKHLPGGELGVVRSGEISGGGGENDQRLVEDLGHIIRRLEELKREIQHKVEEIRG